MRQKKPWMQATSIYSATIPHWQSRVRILFSWTAENQNWNMKNFWTVRFAMTY